MNSLDNRSAEDAAGSAGEEAARQGLPITANPFTTADRLHLVWDYEWCAFHCFRAVDEGKAARKSGQPRSSCPYTDREHGDICGAWYHGWDSNDDA